MSNNQEAIEFMRDTIYSWIGNLMRDLDAQGTPIDLVDVATALEQVAYKVGEVPTKEDYEDFLDDLNDGRGTE